MTGIDPTIQPGSIKEKYEIMKARMIADGSWNEDRENELLRVLGVDQNGGVETESEEIGEVTPEAASTDVPTVAKPRAKRRIKAKK